MIAEREGMSLGSLYDVVGVMRAGGWPMPDRRKHRVAR